MPEEVKRKLAILTETAHELTEEIKKLDEETGSQTRTLIQRMTRNQRVMWMVIGSLLLDLTITVVLALTVHGTSENNHRLDQITQDVQRVQTIQGEKVLCPLYQQFLNSDTPKARKLAELNGQDMKVRAQAFKVIREGYNTLGCTNK